VDLPQAATILQAVAQAYGTAAAAASLAKPLGMAQQNLLALGSCTDYFGARTHVWWLGDSLMVGREGPDPINQLLVSLALTLAFVLAVLVAGWFLLR
jgi:hypothetical protein